MGDVLMYGWLVVDRYEKSIPGWYGRITIYTDPADAEKAVGRTPLTAGFAGPYRVQHCAITKGSVDEILERHRGDAETQRKS